MPAGPGSQRPQAPEPGPPTLLGVVMRELTGHKVNPANDTLQITVLDEPGSGGANHVYAITGMQLDRNSAALAVPDTAAESAIAADAATIVFQCGPIAEHGVNGITQEALIEICIDRLKSFQALRA